MGMAAIVHGHGGAQYHATGPPNRRLRGRCQKRRHRKSSSWVGLVLRALRDWLPRAESGVMAEGQAGIVERGTHAQPYNLLASPGHFICFGIAEDARAWPRVMPDNHVC